MCANFGFGALAGVRRPLGCHIRRLSGPRMCSRDLRDFRALRGLQRLDRRNLQLAGGLSRRLNGVRAVAGLGCEPGDGRLDLRLRLRGFFRGFRPALRLSPCVLPGNDPGLMPSRIGSGFGQGIGTGFGRGLRPHPRQSVGPGLCRKSRGLGLSQSVRPRRKPSRHGRHGDDADGKHPPGLDIENHRLAPASPLCPTHIEDGLSCRKRRQQAPPPREAV